MPTALRWFDHALPTNEAIEVAAHVYAAVPPGWQSLWHQTMRQLVNVRTPDREFSFLYLSVDWDNGLLQLDMPYADEVLTGIARKCAERSKSICRQCGKRGRMRTFGMHKVAVLCPKCAAPQLLHLAIDDTVRFPGLIALAGRVDGLHRVPEILRKSFVRAAKPKCREAQSEPSMDKAEFQNWVAYLKKVKTLLPAYPMGSEERACRG